MYMSLLKQTIRKMHIIHKLRLAKCAYARVKPNGSLFELGIYILRNYFRLYVANGKGMGERIARLLKRTDITFSNLDYYLYSIDEFKGIYAQLPIVNNFTVDYSMVIRHSLNELKMQCDVESKLAIDAVIAYVRRAGKVIMHTSNPRKESVRDALLHWIDNPAQTLDEALQRILVFNQILWQTGHKLVGIGRLDVLLDELYEKQKLTNPLYDQQAEVMINEFLSALHKDYKFKSTVLIGDTGQVITIGGLGNDGTYFCNELTYMLIRRVKKAHLSDPKLVLRVSQSIPQGLMELALECIATGTGSPLLSNDDVILPILREFGYEDKDAVAYATSACWEPFIPGMTSDPNNLGSIDFLRPLASIMHQENPQPHLDFDELMSAYKYRLKESIESTIKRVKAIEFEDAPLVNALAATTTRDHQPLKYNHIGLTSVGMANMVNAFMNIRMLVFEEHAYTWADIVEACKHDFVGHDIMRELLLKSEPRFGRDDPDTLDLANDIFTCASEVVSTHKTDGGGRFKIGLSSPAYISAGHDCLATPDGRKQGQPYSVHISASGEIAYTELILFASKLNYQDNRFNGNVVDIYTTPAFLRENKEKVVSLLYAGIRIGFFQLQISVADSATLMHAKTHPDEHRDLIVRVWGFSAYYVELPEEYKDMMIRRALESEKRS